MSVTLEMSHSKTLGVTFEDVQAEALLDTLANTLLEAEAVFLGNKLGHVYIKAQVDTLSALIAEVQAGKLGQTIELW